MDLSKVSSFRNEIWDRKIINSFWIISLIYVIGQIAFFILAIFLYTEFSIEHYLINKVAVPNAIIFVIIMLTEIQFKYVKKNTGFFIILSSILITYTVFVFVGPSIVGIQIVLILPILISIFYFNKKIMILTCLADISIVTFIYIISPYQRQNLLIFGLVAIILALVGAVIAGIGILDKGGEVMKELERVIKSEEKMLIEKSIIDKLSKIDSLTGLYNHKSFHEFISPAIEQCDQYGLPMQLALLDIDDFKKVNDTYGHQAGDMVLNEISRMISNFATSDDFIARYGGDEFVIVFTSKNMEDTFKIVEKIRDTIRNTPFIQFEGHKITVSIGLSEYKRYEGKDAFFNNTDKFLYDAKRSGKNKTVCPVQ